MGVVSKLTELAKVKLTVNAAPATGRTAPATTASSPAGGLTAEQLIEALETAQKRGIRA